MPTQRIRPKHFPEGIFISFFALAINIITTVVGVVASDDAKIAKILVYAILLPVCFFIFIVYLAAKYSFLRYSWNIKPTFASCCINKSMAYDVAYCTMALFYLAGDNLRSNVCGNDCGPCPTIGHFFTGASLIINIAIAVIKAGDLKPKFPSAIPVIGTMGNVYSKLLEIAAAALTIDLTFTAILEPFDTQQEKCNVTINTGTAIGSMVGLLVIVILLLLIVFGLLACANSVCCDCKREEVKRKEVCGQWFSAIIVVVFVVLFIGSDVDWFWNIVISEKDRGMPTWPLPKIIRLVALCLSFLALTTLMVIYFGVIFCPGFSVALRKDGFFLPERAGNELTVVQHMVRKGYNAWDAKGTAEVTHNRDGELKGKFTIRNEFDKAAITLDVNEEIKCWDACGQLYTRFNKWKTMKGDTDDQTDWTLKAYLFRGKPDEQKEKARNDWGDTSIGASSTQQEVNHGTNVGAVASVVEAAPVKGHSHGMNVKKSTAVVNAASTKGHSDGMTVNTSTAVVNAASIEPSKGLGHEVSAHTSTVVVNTLAIPPSHTQNRGIGMHTLGTTSVYNTAGGVVIAVSENTF